MEDMITEYEILFGKTFIYLFIIYYILSSIDPLQGRRPTGCESSQGTLNSYKEYY